MTFPLQKLPDILYDERLLVVREGITTGETINYVDGKPVKRDPELFHITCMTAPITGEELLLVPEADRYLEQFNVYAVTSATSPMVHVNDKIIRKGKLYHVQGVKDWENFTESRMTAVDVIPSDMPSGILNGLD